jgi:hypothetical protein
MLLLLGFWSTSAAAATAAKFGEAIALVNVLSKASIPAERTAAFPLWRTSTTWARKMPQRSYRTMATANVNNNRTTARRQLW